MTFSPALSAKLESCPVCSGRALHSFYAGEGVAVDACRSCGLHFNNPPVPQKPVEQIYTSEYYASSKPALGYEDYAGSREDIQKSFRRKIRHLQKYLPSGKLLDVGCACGFFLEVAHDCGYEVTGIDVSEWATEYARKHYPFSIHTGFLEQNRTFPPGSFDVVTCWDVMEQLPEPEKLFRAIRSVLRPGGFLVLTIRDIRSVMAAWLKERWIHFRPSEKFVYFTPKALRLFLSRAGFDLVSLSSRGAGKDCTLKILLHKMEHAVPWLARCAAGPVRGLGLAQKSLYLNFGDSLIAVARKGESK